MQANSKGPFKENSIFFTLWTTVSLRSDSLTMRHESPWRPSRLYAFWLLSEEDLGYFCYASEAVTHLSFTLAWLQVLFNPFFLLSALPFFEPFGMYCPLKIRSTGRETQFRTAAESSDLSKKGFYEFLVIALREIYQS